MRRLEVQALPRVQGEARAAALHGFVDPSSGEPLRVQGKSLVDPKGRAVAPIVAGIPRFVDPTRNYAEAFGFQWKTWRTLSDSLHGGRGK